MRMLAWVLVLVVACGDDDGDPVDAGADSGQDAGSDAARPDAGFDAGPPPTDAPYRGPWVIQAETDRAVVRWETYALMPSNVAVDVTPEGGGATTSYEGTTRSEMLDFSFSNLLTELPDPAGMHHLHEVVIEGLSPATCYEYVIAGFEENGGRFCTMHERADRTPIEFLVIGDSNPFLGASAMVLEHTLEEPVEFVVHLGDLQYYDSIGETWNLWFRDMAPMIEVGAFYPTIGNHEDEVDGEFAATYARWFDQPSRDGDTSRFHFETGGVHFFSVNSEDDIGDYDPTFAWLEESLTAAEATDNYRFSIVYFHRPMYTLARHAPSMRVRSAIEPIVTRHNVPIVLQGHNHVYERFEVGDITYIVSGGGGSGRYDLDSHVEDRPGEAAMRVAAGRWFHGMRVRITENNLHADVIDETDALVDQFDIVVP
ncbi:MAG: metallophosphoesterase [Myxococcota bacterium]